MSTLVLTESDVEQLLDMSTAIGVVEEAFRRLAMGEADNVPRARCKAPGMVLHSMSAAAGYLGFVGWKQYTTTKVGAKFVVGLHKQDNGQLVALIEANRLGQLRTGAVTGVAAKHLAPGNADRLGLFGTGWQAESQLRAVAAVRPIRRAFVYSRRSESRFAFAQRMSAELKIDVAPADDPQQAVVDMPIVITATTSKTPVFDGEWLEANALVCAMGSNWLNKAEIDVTTIRRAETIVCDSIECCQREAGDFVPAIEQGVFDWSRAIELAQVVSGKATVSSNNGIRIFKSVGMAIEDVAVGAELIELARDRNIGKSIELFS
jgi:alanine dehydrogenase